MGKLIDIRKLINKRLIRYEKTSKDMRKQRYER